MGNAPLAKTHDVAHCYPEEDPSMPLNSLGGHHFQMIVGCLDWISTLVRMDTTCAASALARFSTGLREGCVARESNVAGYMKKRPNLELLHDPT